MYAADLKAWREREGLTQAQAAERLGCERKRVIRLEASAALLPDDILLATGMVQEAPPRLQPDRPVPLATVTQAKTVLAGAGKPQPRTLPGMPPGTVGYLERDWPYGAVWGVRDLPKGRWRVRLAKPMRLPNGVEITAVEYCSNGVGSPSMIVMGRSNGAEPMLDAGLAYGSYHPWRADPNKPSVPYHVDDLLKGKSKSDARR